MHALVRFAHIAGGDTFTTKDLHPAAAAALEVTTDQYRLASVRYDLSKLRAKHLVEKVEHSRRYRLLPQGYRICVLFLKLFERVYAPLTAGSSGPSRPMPRWLKRNAINSTDSINASSPTWTSFCAPSV